jgi:hypothetical protein
VLLKFDSATPEAVERDFGVADVAERVSRIQLAEALGWTFDVIDRLSWRDRQDIMAYFAAKSKASRGGAKGKR